MRRLILTAFLPLAFCSYSQAQVSLHIDIGLPIAPPLVEVRPGIQVVEGFDDEVFFYSGWYWCRRPDGWYRARSPRASFAFIESRRVPLSLIRVPEGRYRRWHHEDDQEWREFRERKHHKHDDEDEDHDGDRGRGHGHGRKHGKHDDD